MTESTKARDVMRTNFVTVCEDQTLGEAMTSLREAQAIAQMPNALMIVDDQQRFVGMLTAKLLIRVLVGTRDGGEGYDDAELLRVAASRLPDRIADTELPEIPVVGPEDNLLTTIRRGIATRLDFVPVVDDRRPVGFAPITEIFQRVAGITLTPDDEGIRFDR